MGRASGQVKKKAATGPRTRSRTARKSWYINGRSPDRISQDQSTLLKSKTQAEKEKAPGTRENKPQTRRS